MRLAVFTDSNIFYIDGAGRIIRELIGYVRRRGTHSVIVFHRGDGKEKTERFGDNAAVYSVVVPYLPVPTYAAYPLLYLRNPKRRLLRIARDFRPDVVLTISPYLPFGIGRSALYAARRLNVPLVGSFDLHLMLVSERYGATVFKSSLATRLWLRCAASLMRAYDHCARILVPSRFIWEYVARRYGASKCVMFPRGVDIEVFSPRHRDQAFKAHYGLAEKTVILYAGRISVEKNLGVLVEAYARLKAENEHTALVLVGEGPEQERIKARGIPDLVLPGALYDAALSRAYASADLFAFPSHVDAGPMVIAEAMASGLPVVVSREGGARDPVVHGETGFVANDPADFAGYLDLLIRDPGLRSAMGAKARAHAEGHSWDRVLDELMTSFAELTRRNG